MCIADDDLVGSQLSPVTPSSLACDKVMVVSNQLSLYSSFLALQAQHASSGHNKIIISALRNFQDDKPKRRRSSHFSHSSTMGSFNLLRLGQTTRSSPRSRLR
jgi:hypothetical protein